MERYLRCTSLWAHLGVTPENFDCLAAAKPVRVLGQQIWKSQLAGLNSGASLGLQGKPAISREKS
eukprot:690953-Pelagomonas_calceolata.AAC.8